MLRIFVAALLAANLGFAVWSQGWLDGVVGTRSIGDREPERIAHQFQPEAVRVLPPEAASAPSSSASAAAAASVIAEAPPGAQTIETASASPSAPTMPSICLEAGPFTDPEFTRVQTAAQSALSGAVLSDQKSIKPGRWLVYMGRYASTDALAKKEEELKRRKLQYTEVNDIPNLTPGLSLGRFSDRAAAGKALEQFADLDIHTARVVELVPASNVHLLRLETADGVLATLARTLKLGVASKGFAPCAAPKT